ncbi:PorP/SprF family type IX secretion system membrane protein [Maribacter chungangensis]|jgi:type IX secretion system PorP/SprF family membrane protein|uniref:PorP/SprF family type IX secretion system membrane protein n=1 Tax=Maribacter chungangensis TaxID=1069117 RepID=A0ABW3B2Y6_9FLAO
MKNFCGALLIGFVVFGLHGQNTPLPNDFRQQNITEYNSSLLNPAYAIDRNNPTSAALWARWQWQTFDADPTSVFFNYTHKLNGESALGGAFFQNNTGVFINTGGALNYAYAIDFSPKVRLGIGLNFFVFQQKLADDRFFQPNPIQRTPENDMVLQMAPGLNLRVDKFNIGFVSENMFDYNLGTNQRNTSPSDRMFFGMASYDIPMEMFNTDGKSYLRPAVYFKSIPGFDTQFGFNSILSNEKFWAQAGYNSFYGISGGAGGRFFKRFSFGALVEFGTSPELSGTDPTFELVTSYRFDSKTKPEAPQEELLAAQEKERLAKEERELLAEQEKELLAVKEKELLAEQEKEALLEKEKELLAEQVKEDSLKEAVKISDQLTEQELKAQERLDKEKARKYKDSVRQSSKNSDVATKVSKRELKRRADSIARANEALAYQEMIALKKQQRQDSIAAVTKAREEAIAQNLKRQQDSIAAVAEAKAEAERLALKNEVVKPKAGERYEEVTKEGNLAPGYYLIANVFGTKRYFDAFMADMKKRGINAGSFYREANKYNYVYLGRYTSIKDARQARESKLDGKYQEKTWIFRVTGE